MDSDLKVEGDDSFVYGVNSAVSPGKLVPGQYAMSLNTINRGGIIQTRPGTASLPFSLTGSNVQGVTFFKPTDGLASLVFMIDGLVYASQYPFTSYFQLTQLTFSKYTKYAAWATCLQSTDYTASGEIITLDKPKNVLIIQDGATRAAMWDGSVARHLNPTKSGSELTREGYDETPVGLWMKWSNNRLWVSRGNKIFASDIGNPLKFTEAQYIAEGRAFYLSGVCMGIAETGDQQGIVCFTNENAVLILSSIQDRSQWLSTPNFQRTIIPDMGCLAPRSIVQQHGIVWWWTARGLVNQDDARRANITSRMTVQDQEMLASKSNISYDVSMVAGGYFENFLLHAVPHGDKQNTRIHVMDQYPDEDGPANTWPSYWEGWRPVEFARGIVSSQERLFAISNDYDGQIRIWEFFKPDRTDNGIPITCFVETKAHFFENRDYKRFKYAEVEMVGLSGEVATMIGVAGLRGGYQKIGTKDISAEIGQVYHDVQYGEGGNDFFGSKKQTRIIKSTDMPEPSECNEECVESTYRGLIDRAFSLLIVWSGIGGVSSYRIFSISNPSAYDGQCEEDETGETRLLTDDGCSSTDVVSDKSGFTQYVAEATFARVDPTSGLHVSATKKASSIISQVDADRKAAATARYYVLSEIGELN